MIKTGWQCVNGLSGMPHNIQKGGGWSICSKRSHRTDDAYFNLAKENHIGWLSPNIPQRDFQTSWVCEYGHHWTASYQREWVGVSGL